VRFFFNTRVPEAASILMVESGSRHVLERAMSGLSKIFPESQFDLCTCFPGLPPAPVHHVWRVTEAHSLSAKLGMAMRIRRSRPPIAAVLATGEPVMFNWKILLLLLLPSKIIVVNENGDFFWLDRSNLSILRQFLGARWGVNGEEMVRAFCRLLAFPFVLLFLLVSGLITYVKRWVRLAFWRLHRAGR
jgi:hypothetical protein